MTIPNIVSVAKGGLVMRRPGKVLATTSMLLLFAVAFSQPSFAQDAVSPSLTFAPSSISIAPSTQVEVSLRITNPLAVEVEVVTLDVATPAGLNFRFDTETLTVGPMRTTAIEGVAELDLAEADFAGGTIVVVAQFDGFPDGLATIDVRRLQPAAPPPLLTASITGTGGEIDDLRPGAVFLQLTNPTALSVSATCVVWQTPNGVEVAEDGLATYPAGDPNCRTAEQVPETGAASKPVIIAPGETISLVYEVKATKLRPGAQHILVAVDAVSEIDGGRSYRAWASATFQASVFGVPASTGLFGIPTFLFLPGLFVILGYGYVRRWMGEDDERVVWANMKSPDSLITAVLLSALILGAFHLLPPVLGLDWSYLDGYGMAEVVRVLTPSLVVPAAVGYWYANKAKKSKAAAQEKHAAAQPPLSKEPSELLAYLVRTEQHWYLKRANLPDDATKFVLVFEGPGTGRWVVPRILANFEEAETDAEAWAIELLDDEARPTVDIAAALAVPGIKVAFETVGSYDGPKLETDSERYELTDGVAPLVEVQ